MRLLFSINPDTAFFGLQSNQHLEIHHDLDSINKTANAKRLLQLVQPLKTQSTESIQKLYKINDKLLLVVDSLGIYTIKSVKSAVGRIEAIAKKLT